MGNLTEWKSVILSWDSGLEVRFSGDGRKDDPRRSGNSSWVHNEGCYDTCEIEVEKRVWEWVCSSRGKKEETNIVDVINKYTNNPSGSVTLYVTSISLLSEYLYSFLHVKDFKRYFFYLFTTLSLLDPLQ